MIPATSWAISVVAGGPLLRRRSGPPAATGCLQGSIRAVFQRQDNVFNRFLLMSETYRPNDEVITLLATGFARGGRGNPAIPYARLED